MFTAFSVTQPSQCPMGVQLLSPQRLQGGGGKKKKPNMEFIRLVYMLLAVHDSSCSPERLPAMNSKKGMSLHKVSTCNK